MRNGNFLLLRSQERFNLQESQYQVKAWLADLLRLEDNEWKFIEAFRKEVLLRQTIKSAIFGAFYSLAEKVGFEPTCPCGQLDFESSSL